jgi:hypothetical protein
VLFYGRDTWSLVLMNGDKLNSFEIMIVSRMLAIRRCDQEAREN